MNTKVLANTSMKMLGYYLLRKYSPLIVSFLTTYRCNQHCTYCDWSTQANQEMNTSQAVSLIEQMKRCGTVKLGFAGGESLIRDDIDLLLECAHKIGFVTSISTNGRAVPAHIDAIQRNVDVLQVSIDGPEEIHDSLRGKGSYKAAIEAIRAAKYAKVNVITNTVFTKTTVVHLPFVMNLAKEMGFSVLFQPAFNYVLSAPDNKIDQLKPSKEQMVKAVNYLINEKRNKHPVGNSFSFLHYMENNWPVGRLKNCHASSLFCTLGPCGEVMPCCFAAPTYEWPNALEIGFKKAFEDSYKNQFAKKCKGCYCNAYIEASMVFSLKPWAILNALKTIN